MIVLLLASLLAAATPDRPAQPILPPQDWSTLPTLLLRRSTDPTAALSAYVREEVLQGRCTAAVRDRMGWILTVEVAVLAGADGIVRRVVPRAIQCPTVEQYAAGLVWSGARDNIDALPGQGDRWYRTRLTFAWGA